MTTAATPSFSIFFTGWRLHIFNSLLPAQDDENLAATETWLFAIAVDQYRQAINTASDDLLMMVCFRYL